MMNNKLLNKMINRKIRIKSVIFCVLVSVLLYGCSRTNESAIKTSDNVNQSKTEVSSNETVSNVPTNSSVTNNAVSETDTTQMPVTEPEKTTVNPEKTTVNKDKSSSPPVKIPKPVIGSGANDMAVFMQVRGALTNLDKSLAEDILVDIKEGNVTLNGNVASEDQKKKAEQVVRGVNGVKSVKNNLRVSS